MNGNLTDGISNSNIVWNWDNKIRSASLAGDSVSFKYTPEGAMVYRQEIVNSVTTKRKYIVDPVGKIPTILMELDPDSGNSIEKTYIHAPGQVLAQHNGDSTAARYYYLQDRLGSVRLLIDDQAVIENDYTYDPFGNFGDDFASETSENIENPYRFAGYVWDKVIQEYYCNARWYDPALARFTGYDPVTGEFKEPMTLHQYLYCINDPLNRIDPDGRIALSIAGAVIGGAAMHSSAIQVAAEGVTTGNDALFELAFDMERLVAPAAYVGAAMYSAPGLDLAFKGAQAVASAGIAAAQNLAYIGLAAGAMLTTEITYLYLYNPVGFTEFITNVLGDPTLPTTAEGAAGMLINRVAEEYLWDKVNW